MLIADADAACPWLTNPGVEAASCDLYMHIYWAGVLLQWTGDVHTSLKYGQQH